MVLGHESAGVVTKVGEGVTSLKVGDRVAIEPGRACQACDRCFEGRYNLCPEMKFSASLLQGPNDGSLRRYVCFPHYLCHRIPDSMSFEEGALMEPLSVAVHSVDRTPVREGSRVLVLGSGPIGLLVAATAFAKGAKECFLLDINPSRLTFAKTYLPQVQTIQLPIAEEVQDDMLDWAQLQVTQLKLDLAMIDVAFECTGVNACIALAMYAVRRGGVVMLIGLGKGRTVMPTDLITTREIDVRGNFRYANAYKKSIELVHQKKISLQGLVSHRFRLEDAVDAYETARTGGSGVLKIQIIGSEMDS
ncbi:hypothetical protein EC973_000009 [Apophysomyces ossiformis]|uniref:Sorbitol dehydrogenase n=1 Tax=Apophysomyces ossiformis TaxID=679940 RepID=A0A8H7C0X6_9FUNG|nr:hypothetical protein EC973_000009 [Apophysomyces ossiformis]